MRGSDENAALHYAARLIEAGDIISLCRRMLCIASEDVGLAYPQAVVITKACVDSALQLGLPEAKLPIAEATILLATAPKSRLYDKKSPFQGTFILGRVDTKPNNASFRQNFTHPALKSLDRRQPACDFLPCLRKIYARKSAYYLSVNTP